MVQYLIKEFDNMMGIHYLNNNSQLIDLMQRYNRIYLGQSVVSFSSNGGLGVLFKKKIERMYYLIEENKYISIYIYIYNKD